MYTFIQIFSIVLFIASVLLLIMIPVGGSMWLSDIRLDLRYPSLNTKEENERLKKRNATFPKRIVILTLVCIPFAFVAFLGIFFSGRGLSEKTCIANDGEWKSWDSGMQWECYNPNLINQGNNFRVITETPEN